MPMPRCAICGTTTHGGVLCDRHREQHPRLVAMEDRLIKAEAKLAALRQAIQRQGAEVFYVTAARELGVGFDAKS